MQLNQLLKDVPHSAYGNHEIDIQHIAYDSRKVQPGSLFIAIKGYHVDGHQFIQAALANGAVAIVYDDPQQAPPSNVAAAKVANAKIALSPITAAFYGHPGRHLDVIGITGTKGKTSTTFLTAAVLEVSKELVGFMSTVDFKIGAEQWSNKTRQSTPEALEIQAMLHKMVKAGCHYAVVESTSHALSPHWNRLGNCEFDIAVITNVTHEHLDYHGSVEQYRQDKAELFRKLQYTPEEKEINGTIITLPKVAIINGDDTNASIYREAAGKEAIILEYGINAANLDIRATAIDASSEGTHFNVVTPDATYTVKLQLVGPFYIYNTLAALTVAYARNINLQHAIQQLEAISGIEGRMERIDQGQPFSVLVDYAHNPDSFKQVMSMMKPLTKGRMIAVFGSAGERDQEKRSLQGAIAAKWCELLILTDEDPRGEKPLKILEDIAEGVAKQGKQEFCMLIPDRKAAIQRAFQEAQPGDLVLLLGKGHEGSILYDTGPVPWNEKQIAQQTLISMGYDLTS